MPNRSLTWAGATILWLLLPVASAVAWHVVSDRLILQDSWRRWIAVGGAAVVYAALGLWLFGWRVPGGARAGWFLIAWALLAGYYAGPLALALVNSAADHSSPRTVLLEDAGARLRALTRLRAIAPDLAGVTFTCSRRAWQAARTGDGRGGVPAALRRGRLGILWVALDPTPPPAGR